MKMKQVNIIILLSCALLGVSQVWVSYLRNSTAREAYDAQQRIVTLSEEIQELKIESASLMRPERLRRIAHEELGMRAPDSGQVIRPGNNPP